MLPRRTLLQSPLALAAKPTMTLAMHQFTSAAAGYRKALEGWAKAGIRHVEPSAVALDDFLKTDTLASAKRVLTDNGLTIVCGVTGVLGLIDPNPKFEENLNLFKKRCEQFAALGAPIVYTPVGTAAKFAAEDYTRCIDNVRRVAETAREFKLKIAAEFVRNSTFLAALPTALRLHRQVAHPNFGILFDCYHFWSGPSKFEDMDQIRPGEIIHAHLNDTPDMPWEQLDLITRVIPGDGIAPLAKILRKLVDKGYSGPISVELFAPNFQQADPFTLATEIKRKSEAVSKMAGL